MYIHHVYICMHICVWMIYTHLKFWITSRALNVLLLVNCPNIIHNASRFYADQLSWSGLCVHHAQHRYHYRRAHLSSTRWCKAALHVTWYDGPTPVPQQKTHTLDQCFTIANMRTCMPMWWWYTYTHPSSKSDCMGCIHIGHSTIKLPHCLHMHRWPQSRQTVVVSLSQHILQVVLSVWSICALSCAALSSETRFMRRWCWSRIIRNAARRNPLLRISQCAFADRLRGVGGVGSCTSGSTWCSI